MSVTCAVCGQSNADGTQFCVNPACGAYLPWDQTAGQREAPQPPQPPPPPAPPPPPPPPTQPQTSRHPRVEPEQRAGVRVELAQPDLTVEPGHLADTQITIHNTGTRVERFMVRVSGPAAPWASIEPADITVYPGQPGVCTLRFAPPRQGASSAGTWKFGVLADSQVTPELQASAVGSVRLGGFRALSATLGPGGTGGGSRTKHSLLVDNQGNAPEQVRLSASDTEGLLRFEMPPGMTVNPGRSVVPFRVTARREWFGKPRRVPFRVVATPADGQPVSADGVRTVRPRLGVLPLVLAAALVAVLAGGVALTMRSSSDSSSSASAGAAAAEASPVVTHKKKRPKPTPSSQETTPESTPEATPEVTPTTPAATPVNPASVLLVEYRREGGLAGYTDRIVVYGDGRVHVNRSLVDKDANLTPDELRNLRANLEHLELGPPDPEPGGADHIKYQLIVNGSSSVRYDFLPPNWQDVVNVLNPVIERQS